MHIGCMVYGGFKGPGTSKKVYVYIIDLDGLGFIGIRYSIYFDMNVPT